MRGKNAILKMTTTTTTRKVIFKHYENPLGIVWL
jgi:hypothetical protein